MKLNKSNNSKIKIIIVDDCLMFQRVMKEVLVKEINCEIIGEASNGEEFLLLDNIHVADIILMDIKMPKLNGFETAKKVTYLYPNAKLIAVTMFSEKIYLDQIVKAGFKGGILKSNFFNNISPAIERVMSGHFYFANDFELQ